MGKAKINSRRKGHAAERKLVKLFEAWWGEPFFRTPGSGSFVTRGFVRKDGVDLAGDIVTTDSGFPFCIESKKVESWKLEQLFSNSEKTIFQDWWEQAASEGHTVGKVPLLVFSKNRSENFMAMRVDHAQAFGILEHLSSGTHLTCILKQSKTPVEVIICTLPRLFQIPPKNLRNAHTL